MPVHHQGEGTVAFIIFNDLIEGIGNNMGYIVKKMTKRKAEDISTWKYDEPYSIYDMDGSKEVLDELLDGSYYAVTNEKKETFSSRHIRLTVATFNKRAIKVYEKLGFKKEKIFNSKTKRGDLEFMSMSIRFDL